MAEKRNVFVPANNYRPWQPLPLLHPCQVQFSACNLAGLSNQLFIRCTLQPGQQSAQAATHKRSRLPPLETTTATKSGSSCR